MEVRMCGLVFFYFCAEKLQNEKLNLMLCNGSSLLYGLVSPVPSQSCLKKRTPSYLGPRRSLWTGALCVASIVQTGASP